MWDNYCNPLYIRSYIVMTDTQIHVYEAGRHSPQVCMYTCSGTVLCIGEQVCMSQNTGRVCVYMFQNTGRTALVLLCIHHKCVCPRIGTSVPAILHTRTHTTQLLVGSPAPTTPPPTHYAAIPRLAIVCEYSYPIFLYSNALIMSRVII